jgi:hypothetical protein
MRTYVNQISLFGETELISLQEDFPVNHTVSLECKREQKMSATFGQKCLEQSGRLPRTGLWAKTFAALLVGMMGWCSSRCRLTWKLRGTKYNRFYFLLQASTPRTGVSGYGLLPTPTVAESWDIKRPRKDSNLQTGGRHAVTLMALGWSGLLPTPTTRDYKGGFAENSEAFLARQKHSRGVPLPEKIQRMTDGKTGQLNPRFVLEMMGFPPGWTELPFQSGEKKV